MVPYRWAVSIEIFLNAGTYLIAPDHTDIFKDRRSSLKGVQLLQDWESGMKNGLCK
jgi:hypothetical protein